MDDLVAQEDLQEAVGIVIVERGVACNDEFVALMAEMTNEVGGARELGVERNGFGLDFGDV